jgi:CRP-like cAMP-binding protein
MLEVLVRKLEHGAELSKADVKALESAVASVKQIETHENLIEEGDRPEFVHIVLEGFACRYKLLEDGGRQIMAWLVPGDFCDLHIAILGEMDHNIGTLSSSKIALIRPDSVVELTHTSASLRRRSGGPRWSTRPSCGSGWSVWAGGMPTGRSRI